MKVNVFPGNSKITLQIEKRTQVHQLVSQPKAIDVAKFMGCYLRVWNNSGQIIPPTKLSDLCVLNGDEYPLQVGFDFQNATELVVLTYEVCDEGSINKTVYVELDTTGYLYDVELDSIDVTGTTAVKMRLYNLMNIVSPAVLPKNSICVFNFSDIISLQKNNDLMGIAEILTHSNCILRDGTLSELHPIVYDTVNLTPAECATYTSIATDYCMGYAGDLNGKGRVVIVTGNDEFVLHPVSTGCPVYYCQKQMTKIAQQVQQALISSGQNGNVDSNEFASAVAAVGVVADKQGKSTQETQSIANKVVNLLPSVRVAAITGVKNLNLSSEKPKLTGLKKTL